MLNRTAVRIGVEFHKDQMTLNAALFKTVTAPMLNLHPVATEVQDNRSIVSSLP